MKNNLNRLSGRKSDPSDNVAKLLRFERSIKPLPAHEQEELSEIESSSSISCRPQRVLSKDKPWSFFREIRRKPQEEGMTVV